MSVAYVNGTSGAGLLSVSLAKPSGVQAGHLLIAIVGQLTSTSATLGAPAGFSQIGATVQGNGLSAAVFAKRDDGTAGPYVFTSSVSGVHAGLVAYSGLGLPVDQAVGVTNPASSHATSGSVNVSYVGETLMFLDASSAGTDAAPSGFASRIAGSGVFVADRLSAPAGPTGVLSGHLTGSQPSGVWLLAVRGGGQGLTMLV